MNFAHKVPYPNLYMKTLNFRKVEYSTGQCISVGGNIVQELKGCGFDSQSRHILRLHIQSLVQANAVPGGVHMGGDRSMSLSHSKVSLSLLLSLNKQ